MMRLFRNKFKGVNGLLTGHFFEVKALYLAEFRILPCVGFVGEMDNTKAFSWIRETYRAEIRKVYQHVYWDHEESNCLFNCTVFVFQDRRMVELAGNYAQLLYTPDQYEWALRLMGELSNFRMAPAPPPQANVIGFVRQSEMN